MSEPVMVMGYGLLETESAPLSGLPLAGLPLAGPDQKRSPLLAPSRFSNF
jgi:hypothetical protein